jgi:DNA polymerase-1
MVDMSAIAAASAAAPMMEPPAPTVLGLELHVDGDYLAYFASGNDETSAGEAKLNALNIIEQFRSRVGATKVIVHMTATGCQKGERYLIATVKPYQGQRDTGRKPKNHAFLQSWIIDYSGPIFTPKVWTSREADDGIAACAHHAVGKQPGYIAIATADKDLRMLPGVHITWRQHEGKRLLTRVNPGDFDVVGQDGKQYGLKFFFLQMLMGDTADNCPGLPEYRSFNKTGVAYKKIGEKGAEAFMADVDNVKDAARVVCELYYENYHRDRNWATMFQDKDITEWADRVCEQAGLMWMRCGLHADITDFADHQGASAIPWPKPIYAAAERLKERVTLARQTLNDTGSSDYQDEPARAAA